MSDTPETDALNMDHYNSVCREAAGAGDAVPIETAYSQMFVLCQKLERSRNALREELERVSARLEAAEKDAERYRWLREPQDHVCVESEDQGADGIYTNVFYALIRDELDAAIDAHRGEEGTGQ